MDSQSDLTNVFVERPFDKKKLWKLCLSVVKTKTVIVFGISATLFRAQQTSALLHMDGKFKFFVIEDELIRNKYNGC